MKKLDSLEASAARSHRSTLMAVTGLSAVSLVLVGSVLLFRSGSLK